MKSSKKPPKKTFEVWWKWKGVSGRQDHKPMLFKRYETRELAEAYLKKIAREKWNRSEFWIVEKD